MNDLTAKEQRAVHTALRFLRLRSALDDFADEETVITERVPVAMLTVLDGGQRSTMKLSRRERRSFAVFLMDDASMSIRRANALDSQGGMARLIGMTMTTRCLVCGDKKSGCTDYCRTHKFAVRAGARRVTEEDLIVDLAGGSWWIWDARGFVLVIGQDTKPKALAILAAGGNVDEVDRLLAGEAL